MASIGPTLPPHLLAKRKHHDNNEDNNHGKKYPSRTPSASPKEEISSKRARILGPSLPPAALDERPQEDPEPEEESSSDDDFGPAPPPVPGSAAHEAELRRTADMESATATAQEQTKVQREEWMLVPPSSGDWASKVDPTKLKNRKFQSGKGSKAPLPPSSSSGRDGGLWTETLEEKRRRLEDEVMGVAKPGTGSRVDGSSTDRRKQMEEEETARRLREYNEKNRGSSLYAEHKKTKPQEKEDDPSKRAFDREKDIAGGMKIGTAKRRELLTKAADFGSRFEKGSYL